MNILVVSQHFPPFNSPRSFRTFELAKELSCIGHDVTVYALLGEYDYSELEMKYGFTVKGYGPSRWGNIDSTGSKRKSVFYRIGVRLFSRTVFPSIEISKLIVKKIHNINRFDLIISIATPFWVHYGIGLIKKNSSSFPIWISDCGDPFSGNPFIKYPKYFIRLEKWWSEMTDYITIPLEEAKVAYLPGCQNKIRVIPQGFDFKNTHICDYKPNPIPTFIFAGAFYEGVRDPRKLLDYLSTIASEFRFIIYTNNPKLIIPFVNKLGHKLSIRNYLPREELLLKLSSADFLINIKNIGSVQSPSKLIDYTLAKRPILSISSFCDLNEQHTIEEFLNGNYTKQDKPIDLSKYDIRTVANNFLKLYKG